MPYRELVRKERIVIDRSQRVGGAFAAAAIPFVFFVLLTYVMTTAVAVDCDRAEGQCTFVRHTLFARETTRVPVADLARVETNTGDGSLGVTVGGTRVLTQDSALRMEKKKLVEQLRAFSTDGSPRFHAELGTWWWPGETIFVLLFAVVALVSALGVGKLVVVLDPTANSLVVATRRYWVVPHRVRLDLSSIKRVTIEDMGDGDRRVRIGTAASNLMTKERAEAAAAAIDEALERLRERD